VSAGPPGSTWGRAGTGTKARDANSTRSAQLAQLLRGRTVAYVVVVGTVAAIVAGAALHSLALATVGSLAVWALVAALAFATADRQAAEDFYRAYAAGRGLEYERGAALLPLTPLLGAGQRRRFEHWMRGPLPGGGTCDLGHYSFETGDRGERERRGTRHHFTVCVVDLESGMRLFPGIFVTRRRGLLGGLEGAHWLSHAARHEVELESARLCDRCQLWVDDGQDELLLRQLFVPSFQVLLAEHPLAPCFEYRAGTLVVYAEHRFEDEGHLDWMLDVTAEIAKRFTAEVEQAAALH
jgi:hypothetical protein